MVTLWRCCVVTQTGVGILDILDFGCINKRYSSNALRDDSQMLICYYPYYLLLNNINFKIFNHHYPLQTNQLIQTRKERSCFFLHHLCC